MTKNRTQEVLYSSEAALRLVDHELSELHDVQDSLAIATAPVGFDGLGDISALLGQANTQILSVLTRLREGRAAIESTAVGKVRITQDKLREVTSATEDAATNILDACDRATAIVDTLDGIEQSETPDRHKAASLRGSLRDELFLMMGALQFQDITSQQLAHASAVLDEMEQRMIEVAKLFDPSVALQLSKLTQPAGSNSPTYDANATTRNADSRQALADEIFTAIRSSTG
ncbi:MAG: hypothetical protein ABI120_20285 [Gemmatimonadaceae bacterium]